MRTLIYVERDLHRDICLVKLTHLRLEYHRQFAVAPRIDLASHGLNREDGVVERHRVHYLSIYRVNPICLSVYLHAYLSIYLYLCIYPSIHPSIYGSNYLSIYLSVYLSIYLSIHLSVCLSIYIYIYITIYIYIY